MEKYVFKDPKNSIALSFIFIETDTKRDRNALSKASAFTNSWDQFQMLEKIFLQKFLEVKAPFLYKGKDDLNVHYIFVEKLSLHVNYVS